MRPGYLQGYGEDTTRPGNFGQVLADNAIRFLNTRDTGLPPEYETGYIPEHMRFSRVFPNYPNIRTLNRCLGHRYL